MSPASSSASLLKQRPPRPSSAAHTTVTIEVGQEKKAYSIYEDLLTHCSGYFRAAFTGSFKEAEEKQLHLEDVTRETFDAFVDWLYLEDELSNRDENGEEHESSLNSHEITEIHIFADRYDIPDLRRDTIDMMFAYFKRGRKTLTAETITMAFESLPDTSLLRKLLVHWYCESKSNVTPEDELLWTHEILHAVLARYRDRIRSLKASFAIDLCDHHYYFSKKERNKCLQSLKTSITLNLCDYHDHANWKERSECRKKRAARESKA